MAVVEQLPEIIKESDSPAPGFSTGLDNPDVSSACEDEVHCTAVGQAAKPWRSVSLIARNCQAIYPIQQEGIRHAMLRHMHINAAMYSNAASSGKWHMDGASPKPHHLYMSEEELIQSQLQSPVRCI